MSWKRKLELTWIGKEEQPRLEPRILVEQPEHSMPADDGTAEGILIHGDNLLALKALEQRFVGRIKCIYIDPPFNTQQALQNYDDGIEHSLWLGLMRDRLLLLKKLLHDEGTIFIHIDDNELGYLIVLADEIFGRSNRKHVVTFRQASATGHKSINPGCVAVTNYILVYAKNSLCWSPKKLFTERKRDTRYNQFIINKQEEFSRWRFTTLSAAFASSMAMSAKEVKAYLKTNPEALSEFVVRNAENVIRWARPDYDSVSKEARAVIDASEADDSRIFRLPREGYSDLYVKGGERILFYADKLKNIDGKLVSGEPLTTLWDDILSNNLHKEGGVDFPKGKKPEALIKRCIELSTNRGDIVLDSFAGSGTTGAVAHKLARKWIMVELGNHAITHIVPRLSRIVRGDDQDGATKASGWKGGGGFRVFRLAPSLLERDGWGNWVISKEYNAAMLAEAMCKHMSFTYAPSQDPAEYWKHGTSSERDFIYVTTQALTHGMLTALSHDVGADRHLLICCKAYSGRAAEFSNLSVRKIPQAVLAACEWGRDDYSLRITASPDSASEPEQTDTDELRVEPRAKSGRKPKAPDAVSPTLFDEPARKLEA